MLTVKQVAEQLNLSRSGVYQLIASGQLQALRLGPRRGAIRVRGEDLAAYLAAAAALPTTHGNSTCAKSNGRPFKHLDAERLRAAWQRQGVRVDQPA